MLLSGLLRSFATAALITCTAIPAIAQSLTDQLSQSGPYGSIANILKATDGAEDALDTGQRLTLFAPTDEAFARLPDDLRDALTAAGGDAARELLLGAHLVREWQEQDDLPVEMQSLGGQRLLVTYTDGALTLRLGADKSLTDPDAIRAARASAAQIRAANSDRIGPLLVHPLDRVLLPEGLGDAITAAEDQATAETVATGSDTQTADPLSQQLARTDGDGTSDALVPDEADTRTQRTESSGVDTVDLPEPNVVVLTPEPAPEAASDPVSTQQQDQAQDASSDDAARDIALTRSVTSVSELLGQTVTSPEGEDLGVVSDLLMALDNGQIETLVISQETGFLGLGGTETLRVALDTLSIDPLQNRLIIDRPDGSDEGSNE
ncbi:fasciclin domain-containing protein [Marivita sp. S0852]|uniref:fasciclin domain-containing protein n=1 Tax=Marivita sp. S0852 TaxID=3373893 RepID=UPI003981D19B